jgi:hypothetical protein
MLLLPPVLDPVYGTEYATRNRKVHVISAFPASTSHIQELNESPFQCNRTVRTSHYHPRAQNFMMCHNMWLDQRDMNIMTATWTDLEFPL